MKCPECNGALESDSIVCPLCTHTKPAVSPGPTDNKPFDNTDTISLVDDGCVRSNIELEVIDGPDKGQAVQITSGHAVLGSGDDVDIHLSDRSVSRRHLELRVLSDGVLAIDLNSKNGTHHGATLIKRTLLDRADTLQLGASTRIRVVQSLERLPDLEENGSFSGYLTANPKMLRVLELLSRIACTDATVLIEGETGTGKELLAHALYERSARKDGPFVVVDCGAAAPSLLESQLFGHMRGSFTGALQDHEGAFEAANHGTVFLDEIGEFSIDLQPKLLRALESRVVRRLGSVEDRRVDVRFIAATHRNLSNMVAEGLFRSDLYYRLAVIRVEIPPLRDRPEDIPLLATHFAHELSSGRVTIDPVTFSTLSQYHWPGNARELRNVLQRAIAVSKSSIEPDDLFLGSVQPATRFLEAKEQVITAFERRYVDALLKRHSGSVSAVAQEAGLSRPAVYALLKRVGRKS